MCKTPTSKSHGVTSVYSKCSWGRWTLNAKHQVKVTSASLTITMNHLTRPTLRDSSRFNDPSDPCGWLRYWLKHLLIFWRHHHWPSTMSSTVNGPFVIISSVHSDHPSRYRPQACLSAIAIYIASWHVRWCRQHAISTSRLPTYLPNHLII